MKIFNLNDIRIHSSTINEIQNSLLNVLSDINDPQIIITLNLDFLRISEANKDFLLICKKSMWNLPDGKGITALLRLKYSKRVERITGNDVFPILLKIAHQYKYRLVLIGSTVKVMLKVKNLIINNYPGLSKNSLLLSPQLNFEKDEQLNAETINEIVSFQPDIVIAALGCPRQEIWLWNNMNQFKSKINIGVGAVFDYYSGIKKRSPELLQKLSLEWFWRLICEPRRLFMRYIVLDLPYFIQKSLRIILDRIK